MDDRLDPRSQHGHRDALERASDDPFVWEVFSLWQCNSALIQWFGNEPPFTVYVPLALQLLMYQEQYTLPTADGTLSATIRTSAYGIPWNGTRPTRRDTGPSMSRLAPLSVCVLWMRSAATIRHTPRSLEGATTLRVSRPVSNRLPRHAQRLHTTTTLTTTLDCSQASSLPPLAGPSHSLSSWRLSASAGEGIRSGKRSGRNRTPLLDPPTPSSIHTLAPNPSCMSNSCPERRTFRWEHPRKPWPVPLSLEQ